MEITDSYRVLGLRMGASYEDIKASYRRLARLYHPDSNLENQQQAKEKFIQVTDAYRCLVNVVKPEAAPSHSPTVNLKADRQRPPEPPPKPPLAKVTIQSPPLQYNPDLSTIDRQLKQRSYSQLQLLLKEQRFPRAIALVEGLAQRLPHDLEVRQWQAITYQRFGRYLIGDRQTEKASLYLKKALKIDPHNKSLWHEVDRGLSQNRPSKIFIEPFANAKSAPQKAPPKGSAQTDLD